METALGAAGWLLGKVLKKLSEDLLAAYVASLGLGDKFQEMQRDMHYTQGLLQVGQDRDLSHNSGLQVLLQQLARKADDAEDALDELHYFIIQDQIHGTQEAAPDLEGGSIRVHARHGLYAARHTFGNWFSCFRKPNADDCVVASYPHNLANSDGGGPTIDKLTFDRVAMSNKLESVLKEIHSLCEPVSKLLDKIPSNSSIATINRPQIGSIVQDKLYGREDTFEKTIHDITTSGMYRSETLSVLPIVGPGGIGKTTFSQHLCSDTRTKLHFSVMVWVCVSTDFDVLKITNQILSCIPATDKEGSTNAYETTNLDQLQKYIAQRLESKRFLIVLDDMWKCDSNKEWEILLAPFRSGKEKGSVILVTTRFPKVANMVKRIDSERETDTIELQGLKSIDFLQFLEACIFGEQKPEYYDAELSGIASKIANKLKGSPLAAQTVGRLLRKNISQEHWNGVLKKHEWLNQQSNDDILPSLKISYDYLPFHLKKCFSCFVLFPEDHRFNAVEINRFWVAIGIIDSSDLGDKNYLEELVGDGFLIKRVNVVGHSHYVMHDLMHELCRSVSAHDCLNIRDFDFRADVVPPTIRHISITVENRYDEKFRNEMGKLKGRIDTVNLRTLMIFREYENRIDEILRDVFKDINGLRVLFIVVNSGESLPHNFSKLIHLQYLKIGSPHSIELALPSTLSRFYHLTVLDLQDWRGSLNLPQNISHLVNLHHFIAKKELHSNVPEVGKMKCLLELKEFHVKKESAGFELRELGELTELGGELSICSLENVTTRTEASGAKLMSKENLRELRLVWGAEQHAIDADVLDALQPHSDLRGLAIMNHGGTTGPSWLCVNIEVTSLETLHLEGVSWSTLLPPFGHLPHLKELILRRISGMSRFGSITDRSLLQLKTLVLDDLPELVEWVIEPNCIFFPRLESIECRDCPSLGVMPFTECSSSSLSSVHIYNCPELCLAPMPHTGTVTEFAVTKYGSHTYYYGKTLVVRGQGHNVALALHNLDRVEDVTIADTQSVSLEVLVKLISLRALHVEGDSNMLLTELHRGVAYTLPSVESLCLTGSQLTRELLSSMFNCLPALSDLQIISCSNEHYEERATQFLSSMGGSSLRTLVLSSCGGLVLLPADEEEAEDMKRSSLESVVISRCGKLFSRCLIGPEATPFFPASIAKLDVYEEWSMRSMALLSNLTSLTYLKLVDCDELTMDGFNPLITVNLRELVVYNNRLHSWGRMSPTSIASPLLHSVVAFNSKQPSHQGLFQLEKLKVDSISAVLVSPVCSLFASTLHTLEFSNEFREERFTRKQEKALQLLTSLRYLEFYHCRNLKALPLRFDGLSSLNKLMVDCCHDLQWMPADGYPKSLHTITISPEPICTELKEQIEKLIARNPGLWVQIGR